MLHSKRRDPVRPFRNHPPAGDNLLEERLDRILEALACQNQLLVELLGAVNALTAATLSIQSRL